MARNGYGRDYGRREGHGRGYDRHSYGMSGYEMGPGWGWDDNDDPNWRGGTYHGLRMQGDSHRAAYGRERFYHQADLGGAGGFDGRYDLPDGWYDRDGLYHEQWEGNTRGGAVPGRWLGHPRYDEGMRRVEDGGVRYDREYLRQYNANSPAIQHGGPRRSWGFSEGPGAPPMRGRHDTRDRPTGERGSPGYDTGVFADNGFQGPGTRGSIPTQKGGG